MRVVRIDWSCIPEVRNFSGDKLYSLLRLAKRNPYVSRPLTWPPSSMWKKNMIHNSLEASDMISKQRKDRM